VEKKKLLRKKLGLAQSLLETIETDYSNFGERRENRRNRDTAGQGLRGSSIVFDFGKKKRPDESRKERFPQIVCWSSEKGKEGRVSHSGNPTRRIGIRRLRNLAEEVYVTPSEKEEDDL